MRDWRRELLDARPVWAGTCKYLNEVCRFSDPISYRRGIANCRKLSTSADELVCREGSESVCSEPGAHGRRVGRRRTGNVDQHPQAPPRGRGVHLPADFVRRFSKDGRQYDSSIRR